MKTLIIIDVQNDFMPKGTLPVPYGDKIVPIINSLMPFFDLIVATQDWHPEDHFSFASNHLGKKPFDQIKIANIEQTLWPNHCVRGSYGAQFHPKLNTKPIETIFRKGTSATIDSYSCFYDNLHQKSTGLAGYLREKQAEKLYFCGLCTDICVYFSIKDALAENFSCVLIEDASQPLALNEFMKIRTELRELGVEILKSVDLS